MEQVFRKILVTTDLSRVANQALPVAFSMARQNAAELLVCHVLEPVHHPDPVNALYAPVGSISEELRREGEARAEKEVRALLPEDLSEAARVILPHGSAAAEILRVIEDLEVDLLVIAPSGRKGVLERLLGGTAYKVVRAAKCPVLVVPPS